MNKSCNSSRTRELVQQLQRVDSSCVVLCAQLLPHCLKRTHFLMLSTTCFYVHAAAKAMSSIATSSHKQSSSLSSGREGVRKAIFSAVEDVEPGLHGYNLVVKVCVLF
jgi:hypothetical protein